MRGLIRIRDPGERGGGVMERWRVALVAVTLGLGACSSSGSATVGPTPASTGPPTPSVPTGTIVFDREIPGTGGDHQLFTVGPDGSDLRLIEAHSWGGILSPAG